MATDINLGRPSNNKRLKVIRDLRGGLHEDPPSSAMKREGMSSKGDEPDNGISGAGNHAPPKSSDEPNPPLSSDDRANPLKLIFWRHRISSEAPSTETPTSLDEPLLRSGDVRK